ncbi:MAG: integral rane sensor signal transduction histidine kinase [Firmicutes bacterium]|nr:integral rane sensor signal transduction histidine kinase [Bacillota bacterium]
MSKSIIFKFYLLITITITILTLFGGYRIIHLEKAVLRHQLEDVLEDAATFLERSFDNNTFAIDASPDKVVSKNEQVMILNSKYQPFVDTVQAIYPHLTMGIFARDLQRNIAISGGDADKLQQIDFDSQFFEIYETAEIKRIETKLPFIFENNRVVVIQYPIMTQGRVNGIVWTSTKLEDLELAINHLVIKLSTIFFLVWIIVTLLVRWVFQSLTNAINILISEIKKDNRKLENSGHPDELIPLINTIEEQNEKLEKAYQEREKIFHNLEKVNRFNIVGEMAASVAHEIRNPMTSVLGFLQLAKIKSDTKVSGYIDIALEELTHANEIIGEFLSLAKNRYVEKSPQNLNNLLGRIESIIYSDCIKKDICLEIKTNEQLPLIFVSRKEIHQLILNLVRNALEAMEKNGILTIETDYDYDYVMLKVKDIGNGIPVELIEQIFEPFYTTKDTGTGLGLLICQSIVDHHQGRITVDSEIGKGTLFTIFFPIYQQK